MGSIGARAGASGVNTSIAANTNNNKKIVPDERHNAIIKKYTKTLANYKDSLKRNPNNVMYQDEVYNYTKLLEAAENLDTTKTEYSGIEAAVALDLLSNRGVTVDISGIIFEGEYTAKTVKTWMSSSPVRVYIDNNNHSFVVNTGTLLSSLQLIRGGRITDNKDIKVRVK